MALGSFYVVGYQFSDGTRGLSQTFSTKRAASTQAKRAAHDGRVASATVVTVEPGTVGTVLAAWPR